jgi:hypothetical protein
LCKIHDLTLLGVNRCITSGSGKRLRMESRKLKRKTKGTSV